MPIVIPVVYLTKAEVDQLRMSVTSVGWLKVQMAVRKVAGAPKGAIALLDGQIICAR